MLIKTKNLVDIFKLVSKIQLYFFPYKYGNMANRKNKFNSKNNKFTGKSEKICKKMFFS